MAGLEVQPASVETNIVLVGCADAAELISRMAAGGVRVGAVDQHTVRMVTHLDVDRAAIERAIAAARQASGSP